MRFQVPQFIETETKLVGPFTLKQFLFVAGGTMIIFMLRYAFNSMFFWILASLPIAAIALGLAFYKIDGVPLPKYIMMAFSFATGSKKFTYKKGETVSDVDQFLVDKRYDSKKQ